MQIPVVLIWFVVVNVVYVTSVPVQQNIHSNDVYDVNKVNWVDRNRFMTENNAPVEFVPWREEGVLKRVSGARQKRVARWVEAAVHGGRIAAKTLKKAYNTYKKSKDSAKRDFSLA